MALDIDKLRGGLEHYRETLEKQRERLRGDFAGLEQHFEALWSEYAGQMAEEFQHRWAGTAEWFEQYLTSARELDQFLRERIEHLHQL